MPEFEVYTTTNRSLGKITVPLTGTVKDIKTEISKLRQKININRQSIRNAIKGKDIKSDTAVTSSNFKDGKVYVKDLGPQISWSFVFLCEYLGPFVVYLIFTTRPWLFYGSPNNFQPMSTTAKIAAVCWSFHYAKRVLETIFVHRFSNATMPLFNLFKNCSYYWGFTAYVAYHINHPLFTPPPHLQMLLGLAIFMLCELGNLSTHLLFRNLRPAGTTVRKIPKPDGNSFNFLFNYVSCPNYTYEVAAWIGFSIMTSCLPAAFFAFIGLGQMTLWALAKDRNYRKEFPDYPKNRKAIIPFIL